MDTLTDLLGRNGFLPHGYCFQWSPGLLWSMVGADLSIALAYFSIPLTILGYVRRRPGVNLGGVAWLFGAFIFACGLTHVLGMWTIWRPDYGLEALVKLVTAAISVFTAVTLWRLLPQALRIPSVDELRAAVRALQQEVDRRHTAEDHLLEVEQSLAATLASIDAGYITTDAQGCVTRMNAVAERITGWRAEDAAGVVLWDVFDRDGRPPGWRERNPVQVLAERGIGATALHHLTCVARDGTRTSVELSAELTRHRDGTLRGMTISFRDTTRLRGAEADVRRLAAVVESSSDAIIAKTLDGRITNWNAAATRMFGYTPDEALGQSVQMLIPPERADEEMQILERVGRGEVVPPFRTVRLTKDGRRLEVSVQVSPIRDERGRIVGGAKSARDLTHQRQIESALRQSQTRLRFALESASIGDWELDLGHDLLQGSLGCGRCFGQQAPLEDWTRESLLQRVHPDDRAAATESLQTAIDSGLPWHAAFRVVWPDQAVHWLRMDGKLLLDEDNGRKLVGIVADVTAVHAADAARERALALEAENQRVQASSRMKSQFLANMSHELRTPLNAVIGFAELLQYGVVAPNSPKHQEYLGHIAGAGRHLLQLINDVLDLSKVEAGKLDFDPAPLDLQALIDEVVATVGPQADARRLRIDAGVAPALRMLELDAGRLKQVLFNYLSNAIKFSHPGERIAVCAVEEGPHMWRLEVEDTGIGVAPHDLPRLFVEFQQLESGHTRDRPGTGLGLALTRSLVEAQGGRVGVYSTLGEGSRFYAVLPRRAGAIAGGAAPLRLLVASHEHAVRDEMARRLTLAGIPADTAGTAEDVERLTRARRYDALTIDLSMAGASGLSGLAQLHADAALAGAAIKAIGMKAEQHGSVAFAVSGVLTKPLRLAELKKAMSALRHALDGGHPVLVVDDDAAARELMQSALAGIGIGSTGVEGGAQALQALRSMRPAAIVLDLLMPQVSGFEVLRALRLDPVWRELPVFVWTAMMLSPAEVAELSRAAQAIVDKGDGGVDLVLDALLRWAGELRPARPVESAEPAEPAP